MSGSRSDSTSRGRSDDTWSGKRTAEEDENSSLSDAPKRIRRDGSRPRIEEEQVQNLLSSRRDYQKDNDRQGADYNRALPSPQPSSCLSSPLSSAPSGLTEDCGEMAQRAMEAWQSTLATKDSHENELLSGSTGANGTVQAGLPPRSPGSPVGGPIQSRECSETTRTSLDRSFRTPLPTQKEPRMPDVSLPRGDNIPAGVNHLPQAPSQQPETWTDPAKLSSTPQSSAELSMVPNASEEPARAVSNEHPRSIPRVNRGLSAYHIAAQYTNDGRPLPPRLSGTLPPPYNHQRSPPRVPAAKGLEGLNTFSSNFSVLTTEAVQRNQASGRIGRRRGKKPSSSEEEQLKPTMTFPKAGLGDPQSESFTPRHDIRSENGQSRDSPQFRDTLSLPQIRNLGPKPAVAQNLPHIHQCIQTQHPASPPQNISSRHPSFQPPPVFFTLDNRAESPLQTSEVQPYVECFVQNTSVLLPIPTYDKEASAHPVNVIMWQNLCDFYKWYADIARVNDIGALMFELLDVHWQEEISFVVPKGSVDYFRTIKQYIWDLYWLAMEINKAPLLFRILITPFSPQEEGPPTRQDSQWDRMLSKNSDWPVDSRDNLGQHYMAIESRPRSQSTQRRNLAPSPEILPRIRSMSSQRQTGSSPMSLSAALQSPPVRSLRNPFDAHQRFNVEVGGHSHSVSHPLPLSPNMRHERTSWDQAMLRERAHGFVTDRPDLELLDQESTVLDKLPYKTGAEVCGVVIDRRSGKGMVAVTGKGYITLNIKTGPDEPGDRYQEVNIQPKQTCMLHGEAVVLYYKRKQMPPALPQQPVSRPETQALQRPRTGSDVDIVVRLQIDGSGRYSLAFDKSVLRPKITTREFFSWFANQSGHCPPHGPTYLKFTFKDAMPAPTSTEIVRGNEDHFNYMRKDIKMQCEKARRYMPDLKEFMILVTVPGWIAPNVEDDEW